ncbi:MAG: hypothetical protein HZB42_15090 [Sphingobacteriales bacterium]|nr:hypothetical protein [Sphingobacteriales bacterium]
MEHSYFSSLLDLHSKIAVAIFSSERTKKSNTNNRCRQVGIKFVINSAGKLYPVTGITKKYYGFGTVGYGKPPVMCQSTFH